MKEIFELINQMSPYLLLGFLLAGIMHAFVPNSLYRRFLGDNSFKSVVNATLLGIPLPLCSCGVIPTAMSLRREGASRSSVVAFLIATPQTGIDSIIATYSILGLPFALTRPLVALVTALFGGQLHNMVDKNSPSSNAPQCAATEKHHQNFGQKILSALRYGYVDMIQDIGRWLIIGLIIAGLITVAVPDTFFAKFADNSLLSILLVLVCAIPMYLCATGSIPIAAALMLKGLSPGTALVLLMAGPAVNAASILVISKAMGKKTLGVYLTSIILGAITFGLIIDYLLPREWFVTPLAQISTCCHDTSYYFNLVCTIVLALLLINAMIRRFTVKPAEQCDCTPAAPRELTLHIEGMRCNHCRANTEKAIASIPGVESVTVELASGVAKITGQPDLEKIREAVESLGFKIKE